MTPEQTLENTTHLYNEIEKSKKKYVAVGLPIEKVGGQIYGDGMTVFQVGAIHEFGATFNHPGGTRYIVRNGRAQFVSNSFVGPVAGVTGPHTITIPRRSFLRVPFATKKDELDKTIAKQYEKIADGESSAERALGIIGLVAENISKKAFTNRGYGQWQDIKPSTKKRKGSGQPLIGTGTLRNSISSVVRDN